jgi:ATP-dependent helicase HrpB
VIPLPIDPHLDAIRAAVRAHRAVVVIAAPGAGKTTRVAPALSAEGPLILLQPRRVAARLLARRIAEEQGWTLGEEVGWHVRFERRFSPRTRVLVATEGILTARLQGDPLLTDVHTVVLDEFHERSLHGDLALALCRQAARARPDLALVVMSATLDAGPVAEFLGGCPVIDVPGRLHPLEVLHRPGTSVADAVREALRTRDGDVLCFLPGAREIGGAERDLGTRPAGVDVWPLHGSLSADAQDAALRPSARRKVILATNLAETSLTVEGVRTVVDSGLQRVLRYDAGTALDRLETERISLDSAQQRAGRAGRLGPGMVLRLWETRDVLPVHREPEIARVDLAAPVLDVVAWGGDPLTFEWFEAPPAEAVRAALALLEDLGAVEEEGRRLTAVGEAMRRLPLHPRLARVFVAAGGSRRAAAVCAVLGEGRLRAGVTGESDVDVLALADRLGALPGSVREAARQLADLGRTLRAGGDDGDESVRRALLAGFPDRVARRREPHGPRLLLASGHGAVLPTSGSLAASEYILALDVTAGDRGPGSEARVRLASGLEAAWLRPTHRDLEHRFDEDAGRVRASETIWYRRLPLQERAVAPDPERAAEVLSLALVRRLAGSPEETLLRRLRFAGLEIDPHELATRACLGRTSLREVSLEESLTFTERRALDTQAPATLAVPSGRRAPLEYREDGTVAASVKLQELFGLGETPRLGPRQEPVLLLLQAPNGRPVQTTRDLRSFWARTYPEVRKELRGRYPRHPWPEDPWNAEPTARTKKK